MTFAVYETFNVAVRMRPVVGIGALLQRLSVIVVCVMFLIHE